MHNVTGFCFGGSRSRVERPVNISVWKGHYIKERDRRDRNLLYRWGVWGNVNLAGMAWLFLALMFQAIYVYTIHTYIL